jgi:hypothetical protein
MEAQTPLYTLKSHCVTPASKNKVMTKVFSEVNVFNRASTVRLQDEEYQVEDIKDLELLNMTEIGGSCLSYK